MSKFEIFNHISESPVRLPMFMSMSCKSLLKGLLEKPEERRFSFEQVAQSAWIKGVSAVRALLVCCRRSMCLRATDVVASILISFARCLARTITFVPAWF
jgi:hypothetical protein